MKKTSGTKVELIAEISSAKRRIKKLEQSEAKRRPAESQREAALAALRGSEERFRTLVENATLGIYRTTPDGRVHLANPALVRMLGYSSFEDLASRDLEKSGFESSYPRAQFMEMMERDGTIKGLESAWTRRTGP